MLFIGGETTVCFITDTNTIQTQIQIQIYLSESKCEIITGSVQLVGGQTIASHTTFPRWQLRKHCVKDFLISKTRSLGGTWGPDF